MAVNRAEELVSGREDGVIAAVLSLERPCRLHAGQQLRINIRGTLNHFGVPESWPDPRSSFAVPRSTYKDWLRFS